LQNRRERVEELALEAQELRAKREIEKLRGEDAEGQRQWAEARRAEALANKRALAELRLQAARDAEQRRRERGQALAQRKRCEWVDGWAGWAVKALPHHAPAEMQLAVYQGVEEALANLSSGQSESLAQGLVVAAAIKALEPWRRQKEIEAAVQESRKQLPALAQRFLEPSEHEVRAMNAAREAIGRLPSDASFEQLRAAAVQAGKEVAKDYEVEQARARAEAQRQERESTKASLVSLGVAHLSAYLSELHANDEIWDEDLGRKPELEAAVRKALEGKLTGNESFEDAQRIAREIVAELG
jgi:hypothetical protein